MTYWTTGELRRLRALYPRMIRSQLALLLPRHDWASIKNAAYRHGVKRNGRHNEYYASVYWLRIAHRYYAMREQQCKENR